MKVRCVACEEYYEYEEDEYSWAQCPNCDFPYKYIEWIRQLQSKITTLERENTVLASKLSAMVNAD